MADGAGDATVLDTIEVVGASGAAAADVYDVPGSVSQISRQAIDERGGARNTADLFRGVAGVDGVIDRQNPGLNVNIRGLQDQGRVNMSVDGARQNFQQSGHGASAFAYVDPELIGGVDIDKGPSSLAGGAGVIGGVVNFRTLNFDDVALPSQDHGVRLNGATGTNAFDFNGSIAAAAKVGETFEFVGAVGRKKLGEYEAGKRGELTYSGPGEPARFTTQDQWSWLAKASGYVADDHKVTLSYTGLSADFGSGSGQAIDLDRVKNHTVVADWRWTPGAWWGDLAAKAYFTRTANDQFRPTRLKDQNGDPNDPDNVQYPAANVAYSIDTYGGSLANTSRFSVPLFDAALTYGGEVLLDKTDTVGALTDPSFDPNGLQFSGTDPVGERVVGGGFARAELKRGEWLQLLAGVRYDSFGMMGSGGVFDGKTVGCGFSKCPTPFDVDVSGGRLSPTATVAVTPVAGLQLYASYEQGYRPPNIQESIIGGEHIGGGPRFAPNPNLKPEISRTWETGVNLKLNGVLKEDDALRAKAAVYTTGIDEFITQGVVFVPGDAFFQNVNLNDRTRLKGFDFEASYDAGWGYVGGAAALIDARYGADYDNGSTTIEPGILGIYLSPKRKLTLDGGVRTLERKLTFGARVTQVTPEDSVTTTGVGYQYRKYTLLDLYATYKISEQFSVRASLENVRDVAYVEALGAPLSPSPGRTFTLGATARF